MSEKKALKVAVAMSGGVDSSVSAALLMRAGFDCAGIFMELSQPEKLQRPCFSKNYRGSTSAKTPEQRAAGAAAAIGIPFRVVNLRNEFKKKVIDYFVREYKAGRTPNPCVVCNKEIKFGALLNWAMKNGFDYLATGHYARLLRSCQLPTTNYQLIRAKDRNKDQAYFLWRLNQKQLRRVLFPIGEMEGKAKVRELAGKFNLPTAQALESNDVCFLADTDIYQFLGKRICGSREGEIITNEGEVVGQHSGLWRYTIGQRKGIGSSGGPYFVVAKDAKNNLLRVSRDENDLLKKDLTAENVNWISGQEPALPLKVKAKIRYRSDFAPALITRKVAKGKKEYQVVFEKPQRAITPGQSVVFYLGEQLLGGGIIK